MELTDAREIVKQLKGVWHGKYGMVRCPAHDDRNPSLSIAQGRTGPVFKCHAGCSFRDVMAALRRHRIEVGRAASEPGAGGSTSNYSLSVVERIWHEARPLEGTLGQRYLIARGLGVDHPMLRFQGRCTFGPVKNPRRVGPALIVPMHEADRLVGLQRIFLDPDDKAHYKRFKPVLCSHRGAAMRLAPARGRLALTEGAEDALAYTLMHGIPAWGLPGADWLANTRIPACVEELIVAFDRGRAGRAAFDRYAERLRAEGRKVRFHAPDAPSKDWSAANLRAIHETAA
ncbi:MAG: toprim domain-containing protein [Sphingomonadales bacterium]|nr:toprim domain-containing protein [Sphingomonadales bacterium]